MSKLKRLLTICSVSTKRLLLCFAVLAFSSTASFANDAINDLWQPKLDSHYKRLASPLSESTDQALILYCWLGSPSCFQLESALNAWSQKSGILIEHRPLIMRPHWRLLAKARLVAKEMAQETLVVSAIYNKLHKEKLAISNEEELFMLIETLGISASRFANIFYSAEINASLKSIEDQSKQLMLNGVPSLIVNNRWHLDAGNLKTSREFLLTTDYLISMNDKP
ncbi:MAG: hypothetical protein HKP09_00325 [Enterobacterales bacterium]|nr:hypothetical protein [Enterobacterales bacterium]